MADHNARHPYISSAKTPYAGRVWFHLDAPMCLPGPKLLPLPIRKEVFTAYRPTTLELMRTELLTERPDGVQVDLIGPNPFDRPESGKVHPEDAKLLAGAIQGLEQMVDRPAATEGAVAKSKSAEAAPGVAESATSAADVVERIEQSFTLPTTFVHPTRPHLKPKRVLKLIVKPDLWCNQYQQVALEDADQNVLGLSGPANVQSRRYVLQRVEARTSLERYALYSAVNDWEVTADGEGPNAEEVDAAAGAAYDHVRDYVVAIRDKETVPLDDQYLVSVPVDDESPPDEMAGNVPVFNVDLIPVAGQKLIFQKATPLLGCEPRRRREPIRVMEREPTGAEAAAIDVLRRKFAVTAAADSEMQSSSGSENEESRKGERRPASRSHGAADAARSGGAGGGRLATKRRKRSYSDSDDDSRSESDSAQEAARARGDSKESRNKRQRTESSEEESSDSEDDSRSSRSESGSYTESDE